MVNGELFNGDPTILNNWFVYGVELLAVADGVVTSVLNDQPDITPFLPNPNKLTKQTAAGNHVVVEMDNGLSYVFGHMQPGSVKVKVGDRVTTGQVLGLVGNSGNTDAPHLHMHVMTGSDIFQGRGIPYEFTNFPVTGSFPTIDDFIPEPPGPPINRTRVTPRTLQKAYPLELDILNFPN
jgi:murein DD-endopeptidase MepM/ murein hydrolase activator NlpD